MSLLQFAEINREYIMYYFLSFTLYLRSICWVGKGNLVERHSIRYFWTKFYQFWKHCMLSGGIQRHALSCYQSEEIKIIYSPEHLQTNTVLPLLSLSIQYLYKYYHCKFLLIKKITLYNIKMITYLNASYIKLVTIKL